MIHLPFCQIDEAAAGEGHRKVAQRRDGKAGQGNGCAAYGEGDAAHGAEAQARGECS